jgi:hypothetical protein
MTAGNVQINIYALSERFVCERRLEEEWEEEDLL